MARTKQTTRHHSSGKSKSRFFHPAEPVRLRALERKFARLRVDSQTSSNNPNFEDVPPAMYNCLQHIVRYVKHLETHPDDRRVLTYLQAAEGFIEFLADKCFWDELPKDWKYDRATAGRWKKKSY